MSFHRLNVIACDADEVEVLLDPYYENEYDFWGFAADQPDITGWDPPGQTNQDNFRTVKWFLEARQKADRSWQAMLPLAEKILGRNLDPKGFVVSPEEKRKIQIGMRQACANSKGFLLEQDIDLLGVLSYETWEKDKCKPGEVLLENPPFFYGCAFLESGREWDYFDSEKEAIESIKNFPPETKIWPISCHT